MQNRLSKQPKWVVEAFEAAQKRGTHLWPQFERPTPLDIEAEIYRDGGPRLVVGWFATLTGTVRQGCSDMHSHSVSRTDKTDTQQMGVMYATKLDALKVARWNLAEKMAEELARLDREIEKEREKQ